MRDASADRLIQKTISQRMREPSGNCADENTTAAYLEDGLSPQEKTAFESHVSECASCQEILALSMKLRAEEEEIGQTAEEPRIGKKTLFHFSIPVPVLAGVFVSVVLIAVLFRMLYQPGVQKPLTAELRPPIQKTETRISAIPMEPPVVSKDRPAKGGSTVQTQAVDNKAKESEFLNRQAAMESFRPAAPAAAVESDAAVPPESSMQKTAGALASMEPAHDRRPRCRHPPLS